MNLLFQRLKRAEVSGQVVVIITLFLAVIVLFTAIVMNIGKIAQMKMFLSMAADSAAMTLASSAGSYANGIKQEVLGGENEQCELGGFWKILAEVFLFIAAVVIFVVSEGTLSPVSLAILGIAAGLEIYSVAQDLANLADVGKLVSQQLREMDESDRFVEFAIQAALFGAVSERVLVIDTHDIDMDTLTTDTVGRFLQLYEERIYDRVSNEKGSQSRVTYSWHDELGWHHVYIQVDAPCGFPRLEYDTSPTFENCWKLAPNYCHSLPGGGYGRVRIIRYDQDRQKLLSFAMGKPIWRFLFTHPGKGAYTDTMAELTNCEYGGGQYGFNCAGIKEALLHGVKSESCVEWGPNAGNIQFIPCSAYGHCACN